VLRSAANPRKPESLENEAVLSATGAPRSFTEITPELWRAFDRAIEATGQTLSPSVSPTDLLPFLQSVQEAVRHAVIGAVSDPVPPPHFVSTSQVMECIRRRFVLEVHAEQAVNAQQAIHILSALGNVQCILDLKVPESTPDLLAGRDAASLLIEIAHDMRSPLAAILFLLDMLRSERSGPVSPLQGQQLRLIYGASLGVMQLACDMIDSVRGAERLVAERRMDFSITETLSSVKDIVQPMAEEKGVEIRMITTGDDTRSGLPNVLNRILLNLTSNAVKFSNGGAVTLGAAQVSPSKVEFSVQDSGREIPPKVMKQLFHPFRHSDVRRSRTFSSAGLGLSICHKLTRALGSDLHVSTSPTQGTRFHFVIDLPVAT
jgi:signal transduction histidine kinase